MLFFKKPQTTKIFKARPENFCPMPTFDSDSEIIQSMKSLCAAFPRSMHLPFRQNDLEHGFLFSWDSGLGGRGACWEEDTFGRPEKPPRKPGRILGPLVSLGREEVVEIFDIAWMLPEEKENLGWGMGFGANLRMGGDDLGIDVRVWVFCASMGVMLFPLTSKLGTVGLFQTRSVPSLPDSSSEKTIVSFPVVFWYIWRRNNETLLILKNHNGNGNGTETESTSNI